MEEKTCLLEQEPPAAPRRAPKAAGVTADRPRANGEKAPDLNMLSIEVTNRCNMRCKMCVSHGAELYQGQADGHPPFMDLRLFRSIVDQYADLEQRGPKCVYPQFQGEPLLHPKFLDLCEYLDRKAIGFSFTTNGSLLTPEKARALLDMKQFAGITFSIDGLHRETYENIRRGANYQKVMDNVNAFLAQRKRSDFSTAVSFTIQPENEGEVEAFLRHWTGKVNYVTMNNVARKGRPVVLDWSPRRIPCGDLWHFMVVLTNGQVVPCCRDYLYQLTMGNLTEASLREVWYGERYERMRALHHQRRWHRLTLCRDCDTWMCRSEERKHEFLPPDITVSRGPFFRLAKKGRYAVIPFERYHPQFAATEGAPASQRRMKILVLCYDNPRDAATIHDHCESFARYSRHEYYYFNPLDKERPLWMNLNDFDAVVIHYSVAAELTYYLRPSWLEALSGSSTLKVMFVQDEYRKVNQRGYLIKELGIDVLFTCVPSSEVGKVYSPEEFPDLTIFCTLTGFVPESLEQQPPDFERERPIDVGYRGRRLGYWYGQLGWEKAQIGKQFLELTRNSRLVCDISSREEDRIYGQHWVDFLRSCRCVLGTESGASVFDFTGEIEFQSMKYLDEHPNANFEEVRELFFREEEGKIRLNQVSPRIFESIACGACLILFEGEYSGVVKPHVHYIPLKKDFSNLEEVLHKIRDADLVRETARRAYQDIISPGRYSYQAFVEGFDRALDMVEAQSRSGPPRPPAEPETQSQASPAARPASRALTRIRSWAVVAMRAARLLGKLGSLYGWRIARTLLRQLTHPFRAALSHVRGRWLVLLYRLRRLKNTLRIDSQPIYRRSYFPLRLHAVKQRLSRLRK